MDNEVTNRLHAVNINSDVEDFFDSYELDLLVSIDELEDYLGKIETLKQKFRRVHSQLKAILGEDTFNTQYANYEEVLAKMNENFRSCRIKISSVKENEKSAKEETEKLQAYYEAEKLRKEIEIMEKESSQKANQCLYERKICIEQITYELKQLSSCSWDSFTDSNAILTMINQLESRLKEFNLIRSKCFGVLGDAEMTRLNIFDDDERLIGFLRAEISNGQRIFSAKKNEEDFESQQKLSDEIREKELAEEEKRLQAEVDEQMKIDNILICAENLYFEIKTRYDTLLSKCSIDLENMDHYEILEVKKREDNIHLELRELIDKASSFEKFVLPCGEAASDLRRRVNAVRDNCTECTQKFISDLNLIVSKRDISEKKLNNAAGLHINIPKFSGYSSELDIFTFRSEFSKLIEPTIPKYLWADVLKRNHLDGAALNLVGKEESIDKIWDQLTRAYGDTRLMLQNKLGSLDKFSNLEKIRDDEKISFHISSLLNIMSDLEKIATEYNLNGELYYGGGL